VWLRVCVLLLLLHPHCTSRAAVLCHGGVSRDGRRGGVIARAQEAVEKAIAEAKTKDEKKVHELVAAHIDEYKAEALGEKIKEYGIKVRHPSPVLLLVKRKAHAWAQARRLTRGHDRGGCTTVDRRRRRAMI